MRVNAVVATVWLAATLPSTVFASAIGSLHGSSSVGPRASNQSAPLLQAASKDDIQKAREMVAKALAESAKLNEDRMAHPARNKYHMAPGTKFGKRDEAVPPLLTFTPELERAAALVAEADAAASNRSSVIEKRNGPFWMEQIDRKGTSPWGPDSDYKVFRNVKDYGAVGDGSTDDTAAINRAIMDGKRCGAKCNGSTVKNAVVYFPHGTYLVSRSIVATFGTELVGDYNDRPTIKGTIDFLGLGIVSTDVYANDGAGPDGKDNEWYVNTANFYRSIRNIKVDVSDVRHGHPICAIHYQVAQATSMHNVEITAKTDSTQRGIFAENGSGGFLSDITVNGGAYGLFGGAQQFTATRMTFNKCNTAVQLIWDWGWMWKSLRVNDCKIGMRLVSEDGTGNIGSLTIVDSMFKNTEKGVVVDKVSTDTGTGTTGLVMDEVIFEKVDKAVVDLNDTVLWNGETDHNTDRWFMGPSYDPDLQRKWTKSEFDNLATVNNTMLQGGDDTDMGVKSTYYLNTRKEYADKSASDFIHLKDYATGDGKTDDTAGVQKALDSAGGKILFADAGIYLLTDTVTVPEGTVIVGEAWTQFAATGDKFGDADHPKVMLRVGEPDKNNRAAVEMQGLIFTTKGPTPGAVLVEWNMIRDDKQFTPIPSTMWDCHVRLGGATGTDLTPAECPALKTGEVREQCQAAALMMHIPKTASGYFENVWLWVADHMIDDPDLEDDKNEMTMVSIFCARGLLIESQGPVWLYGTASEHSVFYQYNFDGAKNVFAGTLQTESPYYQPSPPAPAPFTKQVGVYESDPEFDCEDSVHSAGCDSSWGLIISDSENIYIATAGIYSWFSTYSEDCIDAHACQQALVNLRFNQGNVLLTNLVTIGANNSVLNYGDFIPSLDNLAVKSHPTWSQISYLSGDGLGSDNDDDIPDINCDEGPLLLRSNLEALSTNIGPDWLPCAPQWAVKILYETLADQIQRYHDEDAANYAAKFNAYASHIDEKIGPAVERALDVDHGECNQYFTCTLETAHAEPWSKPCPFTRTDTIQLTKYNITYTLNDEAGFNKTLSEKYGVLPEWIEFGELTTNIPKKGVQPATYIVQKKVPKKASNVRIIDPKDVIAKSMDGYQTLMSTLLGTYLRMKSGWWLGDDVDPMAAYVIPVSMITDAVNIMSQVADIGEKEIEEDTEKFIMTIVNIVLLALPFAGELVGPLVGLTSMIGRIITLIDAGGQGAVAFYDIAAHPDQAPMDFLGLMVGVGGVVKGFGREVEDMEKLSKLRREIKPEEIEKMGEMTKKNNRLVSNMMDKCYRR